MDFYSWLINNARNPGGDPNFGGAYSLNPPEAIMSGIRGQAVQDSGARERAARLGLQARGDTDPSTYGFQSLMSQLGGQDQTARTMGQADLGLRQQQLQNYWDMLTQMGNLQMGQEGQNRQSRAAWEAGGGRSGWGQAGTMLGQMAAAYIGRGGGGGGGAQPPRMGEGGFRYPYGG
jgi:hypothetical protein